MSKKPKKAKRDSITGLRIGADVYGEGAVYDQYVISDGLFSFIGGFAPGVNTGSPPLFSVDVTPKKLTLFFSDRDLDDPRGYTAMKVVMIGKARSQRLPTGEQLATDFAIKQIAVGIYGTGEVSTEAISGGRARKLRFAQAAAPGQPPILPQAPLISFGAGPLFDQLAELGIGPFPPRNQALGPFTADFQEAWWATGLAPLV
jgi:hypothetical protein